MQAKSSGTQKIKISVIVEAVVIGGILCGAAIAGLWYLQAQRHDASDQPVQTLAQDIARQVTIMSDLGALRGIEVEKSEDEALLVHASFADESQNYSVEIPLQSSTSQARVVLGIRPKVLVWDTTSHSHSTEDRAYSHSIDW